MPEILPDVTPETLAQEKRAASAAVALVDIRKPDPKDTLLGGRFLCRGGALLLVGPTGIGKSSAVVQASACWALGREGLGIAPARPLKILLVQAENDTGDLWEMWQGARIGAGIEALEVEALRERLLVVTERKRTGQEFLDGVLEPEMEAHRPDIVAIDPLLAFIGGDINKQEVTSSFLRNGLNPLLEAHGCGAIISHHTPKRAARDSSGRRMRRAAPASAVPPLRP